MSSSKGSQRARASDRKEKHLAICTDPSRYPVEGGGAGFEGVRFLHEALPELDARALDTTAAFLGAAVPVPFFISCMTGGSEGGFRVNRALAAAAQRLGIPVGLGSIRVLLDDPSLLPHFAVKPLAPGVPVLANIGAVQVRDGSHRDLLALVERLEAQALVVHLNPGQELFQPDGDRDFRGLRDGIRRLCGESRVPVIVKETGFGIGPDLARELFSLGAAYVDLAGAGGTNWISVESFRLPARERPGAEEFRGWGLPTALLLAALGDTPPRVLASGGLRTGMDAAKALALGAELAGLALPAARAAVDGGVDAVVELFRGLEKTLRAVMVMTGSRTVADLRRGTVWMTPAFAAEAEALRRASAARAAAAKEHHTHA